MTSPTTPDSNRERARRRRAYWISHRLQSPFIRISLGHVAFLVALCATALIGPLLVVMRHDQTSAQDRYQFALQLLYIHERLWPAALLGCVVVLIDAIRVSHRFAGPLYRLRACMKQAGQGSIPAHIRLRRGDYLHAEADALNEVFDHMRGQQAEITALRAEIAQLQSDPQSRDNWTQLARPAATPGAEDEPIEHVAQPVRESVRSPAP